MSPKPDPAAAPDLQQLRLHHAVEAVLRSPLTGSAVAEALVCQTAERAARSLVADLRARRVQNACERDADAREAAWSCPDREATPWPRPA